MAAAQSMDIMNRSAEAFLQCTEDAVYRGHVNTSRDCVITYFGTCKHVHDAECVKTC